MSNSIKTLGEAWKVWEANGLPHPGPSEYAFPVAEALAKLRREKEQLALVIDSNHFPHTTAKILSERDSEIERLKVERDEYKDECAALQDDIERLETEREEARAELDRLRNHLRKSAPERELELSAEVDRLQSLLPAVAKAVKVACVDQANQREKEWRDNYQTRPHEGKQARMNEAGAISAKISGAVDCEKIVREVEQASSKGSER